MKKIVKWRTRTVWKASAVGKLMTDGALNVHRNYHSRNCFFHALAGEHKKKRLFRFSSRAFVVFSNKLSCGHSSTLTFLFLVLVTTPTLNSMLRFSHEFQTLKALNVIKHLYGEILTATFRTQVMGNWINFQREYYFHGGWIWSEDNVIS